MIRLDLPERIVTSRLILCRLRYEDAEEIFYTYASKPDVTKYMSWPTHQSVEDTRAFLRYAVSGWYEGIDYSFSIRLRSNNKLIGSFGVVNEDGKLQFGYIFSPQYWNQGYATEVCREMMPRLRAQPGVFRIGTYVDTENGASLQVLRNAGLVEEGVLRQWMRFPNQGNNPKDCVAFVFAPTGSADRGANTADSIASSQ
jgi:RimJ/RimL family protein N-acetyltransferase